ncbi:hypothetical protein ACFQAT_10280 [Undibacterium arcticum]|uniref:hypothetical protein n=1 Tax=Undibacterium arcticum TaxID=1762892 RepID=UPI003609F2B9
MRGILTAIKDGDTTPEQAFSNADLPAATPKMPQSKSAAKAKTEAAATDAQEPAETKPAAAASQSVPASSSELLSGSQINLINSKMEADALGSADLFAKFGVKLGDLTQDRFQEVLDWIRNPAA